MLVTIGLLPELTPSAVPSTRPDQVSSTRPPTRMER
jgi:hypothetical protein